MKQFHRVERYLDRIREIYRGRPHIYSDPLNYEDDVVSFFVHCHHLYDWVAARDMPGGSKAELNAFINAHQELVVCADLCNGSKHCKLERVRGGTQPRLIGNSWIIATYVPATGRPVTFQASYRILSGTRSLDALALAETCYRLWRDRYRQMALTRI